MNYIGLSANKGENMKTYQLSEQALGAIMLALQNSLLNQTAITPVLKEMNFLETPEYKLVCENPPTLEYTENN